MPHESQQGDVETVTSRITQNQCCSTAAAQTDVTGQGVTDVISSTLHFT